MQPAPLFKPATNLASKPEAAKITSKSYVEAYKFITNSFQTQITRYLFGISYTLAVLFQVGLAPNIFATVFSFKTFFFTFGLYTTGGLICFIRNLTFTIWEPTYPSYIAELFANWTSLDNLILFGLYTVSSLAIIRTYLSFVLGEKYTSEFLLQPPGHYLGARQINQDNIFICVYCVVLAASYTYNYISNRKYVIKINNVQQPLFYELKTSLASVLCSSAKSALKSFRNAYFIYFACNGSIYYYVAHLLGFYNRVLDTPIIGFRWVDTHLFLRVIVSGILTTTIFNLSNRLYDAVYSYTLPYTDPYANQFDCLLEGLAEKEKEHIKVAAFSELAVLATKRPDKRVALFNTVGRELQDCAWFKIMTQCLNVIQEFRTNIDIEYNGIQKASAPLPVSKPVEQRIGDRLEFSQGNIFTSARKNQIYYDDRTSTIFSEVSELAEHDINATVPNAVNTFASKSYANFTQNDMVKMLKEIELKMGGSDIFKPYYADTVARRIQTVFNKYQLLVWAVQALGSLTAGSLKEDQYGYVQNDINGVLNQLLGCLVDVETYVKSPPAQYKNLLDEHQVVGETEAVIMALREAIYQITIAFKDYTQVFKIDGKYRKKWDRFLAFQE